MGIEASEREHQVQLIDNASKDLKKLIIFCLCRAYML